MRWIAVWLATLLPAFAVAEPFPALYRVVDVAADDALNVRRKARDGSDLIGSFAPGETVEVMGVSSDGGWGRVNAGEVSGWAALRFLERLPNQDDRLPALGSCYGTEPFWNLSLDPDVPSFSTPADDLPIEPPRYRQSSNRIDRFAIFSASEHGDIHAIVARQECTDGMSDRVFGLGIDVIYLDAVLSGCCTLAR